MRTKRSNEVTPPFSEQIFAKVSSGIDLKISERARRVLLLHRAAHEAGAVEFALANSPGGYAPYPAPDPNEMEKVSLIIDAYYDALYKAAAKSASSSQTTLNKDPTFEQFIECESDEVKYAARTAFYGCYFDQLFQENKLTANIVPNAGIKHFGMRLLVPVAALRRARLLVSDYCKSYPMAIQIYRM